MLKSKQSRTILSGAFSSLLVTFAIATGSNALTDQEKKAQMPADLGKPTIDVSNYPAAQKANYELFQQKCSACHTSARALYSSFTTHEEWEHYVTIMNGRFQSREMKPDWKADEGRRIIDFLTYDSQVRKINQRPAFQDMCRQLAHRFEEVQKQRAEEAKHHPIQPSAPYTGANP